MTYTLDARLDLARRLNSDVLAPLKLVFVDKDEIIDLLGVCLVGGENLFILGPPGTAKSAIVHALARRIEGETFDYLLTRFTEPNELFGPFDIRRLREGDLVTNTEGMLPEASLVFLDELLNANSAILNSLLMVLNERVFRRGRETRALPLLMVIGASNRLPEDDTLGALFDRFLLRVRSDNVNDEHLSEVLQAGWKLDADRESMPPAAMSVANLRLVQTVLSEIDLSGVRSKYVELVRRLRRAGIAISDRRAVKLQRLIAASSALCGRVQANTTDLWVLRYIWDTEEQREIIAAMVQEVIAASEKEDFQTAHPRAQGDVPTAEELARELERIRECLTEERSSAENLSTLRDHISLLAGRSAWIADSQQRAYLDQKVQELWSLAKEPT